MCSNWTSSCSFEVAVVVVVLSLGKLACCGWRIGVQRQLVDDMGTVETKIQIPLKNLFNVARPRVRIKVTLICDSRVALGFGPRGLANNADQ